MSHDSSLSEEQLVLLPGVPDYFKQDHILIKSLGKPNLIELLETVQAKGYFIQTQKSGNRKTSKNEKTDSEPCSGNAEKVNQSATETSNLSGKTWAPLFIPKTLHKIVLFKNVEKFDGEDSVQKISKPILDQLEHIRNIVGLEDGKFLKVDIVILVAQTLRKKTSQIKQKIAEKILLETSQIQLYVLMTNKKVPKFSTNAKEAAGLSEDDFKKLITELPSEDENWQLSKILQQDICTQKVTLNIGEKERKLVDSWESYIAKRKEDDGLISVPDWNRDTSTSLLLSVTAEGKTLSLS